MGTILDAWRVVDAHDGTQKLTLVHIGGRIETVPAPFLPYAYLYGTRDEVDFWLHSNGIPFLSVTEEECVALSALESGPATWCKVEFQNIHGVSTVNKFVSGNVYPGWPLTERTFREMRTWREKDIMGRPACLAENHVAFVERVMADKPGWLDEQTNVGLEDITIMWLDIEQSQKLIGKSSEGNEIMAFPETDDPIISIAWEAEGPGVPEHLKQGVLLVNEDDLKKTRRVGGIGEVRLWDKRILEEFRQIWEAIDTDVLVGFNCHGFDLPMLSARGNAVGIGSGWLCRGRGTPRFTEEKVGMWEKERCELRGRVVFDVFEKVYLDQSLNGKVKDRSLKTVAEYRKLPVIREDTSNMMALLRASPERVMKYNASDVRLTRQLSEPYWANLLALTKMTQSTLRHVVDASANFYGTRFSAEDFAQAPAAWHNGRRVLSDGSNYKRYSHLQPSDAEGKSIPIVTGARVGIHKRGLFDAPRPCGKCKRCKPGSDVAECEEYGLFKVDVGAMYPSIEETLGVGPDNTVHVGTDDNAGLTFFARVLPDSPVKSGVHAWREYSIPDHAWRTNHIIRVYGQSNLALRIKKAKLTRKALKKKMKDHPKNSPEYLALDGQQDALKTWLNSVYGNNANEYARYGSYAVSMITTGMGRLIGALIEEHLGDGAVETDTDGVYGDKRVSEESVNRAITEFVRERCHVEENTIKVDLDEYVKGFFDSMKNYVLLEKLDDGELKIIKHGSGFLGTKHCPLEDEAVDLAIRELFDLEPKGSWDTWRDTQAAMLRGHSISLNRLAMRIRVQSIADYKSNAQGKQVAESHKRVYGREPPRHTNVAFVKTKSGYEVPATPGLHRRVDVAYYIALIDEVRAMFLPPKVQQMTFSHFM